MSQVTLAGHCFDRYCHVCAFFNSRDEEYGVLGPYLKEGIEAGERVVTIVNPRLVDDHLGRLGAIGVDAKRKVHDGGLQVVPWDQAYLKDGVFDMDRMLGMIAAALSAGKEEGYPGMRLMGNMGWAYLGRPGTERIVEYESRANLVLERFGQPAVCVYDAARMSGQLMMDILRTHPMTLIGGVLHQNPYYTPPERLLPELARRRKALQPA